MGNNNRKIKEKMIELYGEECFIEKLKLRPVGEIRHYKSKSQYKRMKQLTYHHIRERRNGGKTTIENGALLSGENHIWFNKQNPETQRKMNELFQKYKQEVGIAIIQGEEIKVQKLQFDMSDSLEIPLYEDNKKYNRAKAKREWKRQAERELYEK